MQYRLKRFTKEDISEDIILKKKIKSNLNKTRLMIFREEGKLKKQRILVYAFEVVKEFIYFFI